LCPDCADSLRRWLERRSKHARREKRVEPGAERPDRADRPEPKRASSRTRHEVARVRQEQLHYFLLFMAMFGTGVVVMFLVFFVFRSS
jgi:ferric-dicitrate binding protein FerR (iron transport regulator)